MERSVEASTPAKNTAYALYLHCSELRRRRTHYVRISKTKLQLTDKLIAQIKQSMATCSYEDLQALNRETQFRRDLKRQLRHRHKQLQLLEKRSPTA
ncbi:uncharacterized protein LOC115622543 [Scaptodrosophila lebanonensis]|uniref:Uncharacterized protein LOC115622543 n=1 Tax=Drosophila lebanonensis TaxID=7225 RepID=A0A6J2TAJ5_DROLE|nr:uncharacterized protein LOC115622543 [Scaptodrosophila lebanonensis]